MDGGVGPANAYKVNLAHYATMTLLERKRKKGGEKIKKKKKVSVMLVLWTHPGLLSQITNFSLLFMIFFQVLLRHFLYVV